MATMPPTRSKRRLSDTEREFAIEKVMALLRNSTILAERISAWNDGGEAATAVYQDASEQFYNNPDKVRIYVLWSLPFRSALVVSMSASERRSRVSPVLAGVRQNGRRSGRSEDAF
jgi:hypothetical protein